MPKYYVEWWTKDNPYVNKTLKDIVKESTGKQLSFPHMTLIRPFLAQDDSKIKELVSELTENDGFNMQLTKTYLYENHFCLEVKASDELTRWRENLATGLIKYTNLGDQALQEIINTNFHITLYHDTSIEKLHQHKERIDTYISTHNVLPLQTSFSNLIILEKKGKGHNYKINSGYDMRTKNFLNREQVLRNIA